MKKILFSFVCLILLVGSSFAASDTWDWSWTTGQFVSEPIYPFSDVNGGNENFDGTTFNVGVGTTAYQYGSYRITSKNAPETSLQAITTQVAHDGLYAGETITSSLGITIQFNMLIDGAPAADSSGPYSTSYEENFGYGYFGGAGDISIEFTADSVWCGPGVVDGSPSAEVDNLTYSLTTDTYHTWRFCVSPTAYASYPVANVYKDGTLVISNATCFSQFVEDSPIPELTWGDLAVYGYADNPCPQCSGVHMWFTDMRIEAGAWDPNHNALFGTVPVELSKFDTME
jgi:hypothetical protein